MKWQMVLLTLCYIAAGEFALADFTKIDDEEKGVTTFQLSVTPAAEPNPIFKYRLTTPLHELKPGNAPAYYRRVHAEGTLRAAKNQLDKDSDRKWDDWYSGENTLKQLPLELLTRANETASRLVKGYIRPGTLCRSCDWGLAVEDLRGPEAVEFLLPEFQEMRLLGRMLSLHTRFAIRKGHYDAAIDSLRTNYRMGCDTGKVPFLVCSLVGYAMAAVANENLRDLIAAPDSTNMYWALTELPTPLVPPYDAGRFEMSLGLRLFPLLDDAETARRTPEEWNEFTKDASRLGDLLGSGDQKELIKQFKEMDLDAAPADHPGYQHAMSRLVDWGFNEKESEGRSRVSSGESSD